MTEPSKGLTLPCDLAGFQTLNSAYRRLCSHSGPPPKWESLDLLDYADLAEHMTILQFSALAARYKVLFKGNTLARYTGHHKGGTFLDETVPEAQLRYLTADLDEVRTRQVPLLKEKTLVWRGMDHLTYRILLMPFRGNAEDVEYILNVLQFESAEPLADS